jgi:hypothetical protein
LNHLVKGEEKGRACSTNGGKIYVWDFVGKLEEERIIRKAKTWVDG